MAIEWLDSFDHYGTGTTGQTNMLAGPYAQLTSSGSTTVQPSTTRGRTGTGSLSFGPHNINTHFRRAFSGSLTTVTVGFAVYLVNLPSNNGFMLGSFADSGGFQYFSVNMNTVGGLRVYTETWNGGTLIEESGPVFTAGGWYYVEINVVHDSVAGSYTVKVNNQTILSKTGVDTGPASAQFIIDNAGSAVNNPAASFYIDDIYCTNTTGSVNTGFLGDIRVYTLAPTGDTISADWAPSTGTDLYAMIDEIPPDGDTTYNSAATVGLKYEVDMDDLPSDVVNVYGVQTVAMMEKDAAGSCGVTMSVDSAGTLGVGTEKAISTNYVYWQDVFDKDPNTSSAWTRTSVNATKMKMEKTT